MPQWLIEKATKSGATLGNAKGIPEAEIKSAIGLGISKVNVDTDLRLAFIANIREALTNSPKEIDPRKILDPAKDGMKQLPKAKCNCLAAQEKHKKIEQGKSPKSLFYSFCFSNFMSLGINS